MTGRFDFIVSNPPYIASSGLKDLELEVRQHDPHLALDGGEDGLDAYRHILAEAGTYLSADGFLGLEIGHDQKTSVSQLAHAHQWGDVLSVRDIAGQDRVLRVR